MVGVRGVVGPVAADAKVDSACSDQRLDRGLDQPEFGRRPGGCEVLGQAVALRDVEDREALQEWDRLRFVACLSGTPAFIARHELVGIDDGGAALALPDISTQRQGLAECEPTLARKTIGDHRSPEDQHIDARITASGCGVGWHGQRGLGCGGPPWLDPRQPPGFQFGKDLAGDFVIQVRPIGVRPVAWIKFRHRGSPRRAPGAFLPALNPSRNTRPTFTLGSGGFTSVGRR